MTAALWVRRLLAHGWPREIATDLARVIASGDETRIPRFADVERAALHMASRVKLTPDEFIAWRNALGISRAEAARRLGLHANSMTNYEQGRTPIPLKVALACAMIAANGGEP